MEERLQKILSRAGVSSRRKAEELITQGCVSVNDRVVTELGSKADFEKDRIRVNGQLVNKPTERLYFMLNKPKGYITSTEDPEGRPTVTSLLGRIGTKVYPVGRLDFASEGLLLLTNDGEFANHVMSAKEVASLASLPSREQLLALLMGTMRAPVAKFVQTLNEVPGKFVRTLAAVQEQRSQQSA